jgi:catechol 2,3-dioxygenase-like lactoylglutathione lyase family enzyme
MSIGMTGIRHVKIPVTDLSRSVSWYARLMELVPLREFVEQGALRGAALRSPEGRFVVALRDRLFCTGQPSLAGFDLVAFGVDSREALVDFAARCDHLGVEHSPIQDRGPDEAVVDVPDPDGMLLRFFWERETEEALRFVGLSFDADGPPAFYDTPQLPDPHSS